MKRLYSKIKEYVNKLFKSKKNDDTIAPITRKNISNGVRGKHYSDMKDGYSVRTYNTSNESNLDEEYLLTAAILNNVVSNGTFFCADIHESNDLFNNDRDPMDYQDSNNFSECEKSIPDSFDYEDSSRNDSSSYDSDSNYDSSSSCDFSGD